MAFNQFSTDNPVSDAMQIEAEKFDPFEFEDPEDPYYPDQEEEFWDYPVEIEVIAWCQASDWHIWETTAGTFESFEEKAQKAHDRECSCGDSGNFDAEIISK